MNELEMKHLLEAALLAAGRPLSAQQLAELYDERERPSVEQIIQALQELAADYQGRGLELVEVSSGWRVQVRHQCIDFVSRLWQERASRYSRALLETLALIAYRQPITRGEIEEIRGVAVSSSLMRTMHDRHWIRVVGHREVPGRPEVLATTKEFLDYFGLKSLDQLPTLAELKDVETVGVQLEFNTNELSAATTTSMNETDAAEAAAELDAASDDDVITHDATDNDLTNDAAAPAESHDVSTDMCNDNEPAPEPTAAASAAEEQDAESEAAVH